MTRIVALITARGGSKRLPRKNVLPVSGKPLIVWTVQAASAARSIARTLVSTDDDEIATVCKSAGGEVPFRRPEHLAGDYSSHYDVVAHAIDWLEANEGGLPDYVLLLQPTTPLRTAEDIDGIAELAGRTGAESLVGVVPVSHHPMLCHRLSATGTLEPYLPRPAGYLRTQDLEPAYAVNGALYLFRPEAFRARKQVLGDHPVAYVMPRERSLDVDDAFDLALVDLALKLRHDSV
jgi:CMP-N-acetylneuraminic acid synthetase